MSIAVTVVPTTGDPVVLASATDFVNGNGLGDNGGVVETVHGFRRDRAEQRPRGGQLDTFTFTVEKVHATHNEAIAYAVAIRRALRLLAMTGPLAVNCSMQSGAAFNFSYANASVQTSGDTRLLGLRTIQTFVVRGALSD